MEAWDRYVVNDVRVAACNIVVHLLDSISNVPDLVHKSEFNLVNCPDHQSRKAVHCCVHRDMSGNFRRKTSF